MTAYIKEINELSKSLNRKKLCRDKAYKKHKNEI